MVKVLLIIFSLFLFSCQSLDVNPHKSKNMKPERSERFKIGMRNLSEIDGEAGERVLAALNEISPDLGTYIIEYAFGDVYNRPELDLKSKEVAVVAALTAMKNLKPQLKVHINGALNVGCSITEVQEIILQMSAYSGFPSAINGMIALKEVLEERRHEGLVDEKGNDMQSSPVPGRVSRYEFGAERLQMLNKNQVEILEETFKDISPDLARFVVEYGFADIYSRPALALKHRQISTIAALTAMGGLESQLEFHIRAGLNIGLTKEEIREIMILMSVYAGMPAAINGTMVLKKVVEL